MQPRERVDYITQSIRFPDDLYHTVKSRSGVLQRSFNQEVIHLIELGLAQGGEEELRLLSALKRVLSEQTVKVESPTGLQVPPLLT